MADVLIYGATGYTGRMAAEHAVRLGLDPILAGRDGERLRALGSALGCESRSFDLTDHVHVRAALYGVTALLNCAGLYLRTARPLMRACLDAQVHYLDIAAELDSYRLAEELHDEATRTGVMLLPGSGGSVALLGCLVGRAAAKVAQPRHVRLAMHLAGPMSRGSALSARDNLTAQTLHRLEGALVARETSDTYPFEFGPGPVACIPMTLPDLITVWRSTHIPNIDTYVHVAGDAFPAGDLAALPDGPTVEQRRAHRLQAVAEVEGSDHQVTRLLADTVNGYTFTPNAAARAAQLVLDGQWKPGFRTPAEVFGLQFAETVDDTHIVEL